MTAMKNCIVDEIGWRADETNSVPTPDDTRSLWGGEEEMGELKELVVDLFVWYGLSFVVSLSPPFPSLARLVAVVVVVGGVLMIDFVFAGRRRTRWFRAIRIVGMRGF